MMSRETERIKRALQVAEDLLRETILQVQSARNDLVQWTKREKPQQKSVKRQQNHERSASKQPRYLPTKEKEEGQNSKEPGKSAERTQGNQGNNRRGRGIKVIWGNLEQISDEEVECVVVDETMEADTATQRSSFPQTDDIEHQAGGQAQEITFSDRTVLAGKAASKAEVEPQLVKSDQRQETTPKDEMEVISMPTTSRHQENAPQEKEEEADNQPTTTTDEQQWEPSEEDLQFLSLGTSWRHMCGELEL